MSKSSNKKSSSNEIVEPSSKSAKKGSKRYAGEAFEKNIEEKVEKQITSGIDDDTNSNNMDTAEPMVDDVSIRIHSFNLSGKPKLHEDSKTLYVSNVDYRISRADIVKFFKRAGKIVDLTYECNEVGRFKGIIRVQFESHEVARKAYYKLNKHTLMDKDVELDALCEGIKVPKYMWDGSIESPTIYVTGIVKAIQAEKLESRLEKYFLRCGQVAWVHAPMEWDTGEALGYAFVNFLDDEGFSKALRLNRSNFYGDSLQVRKAKVFRT